MPLPIDFRTAVKKRIRGYVDDLISQKVEPQSQAKARWKFENSADWHHGHFVGLMSGVAGSMYYALYKKQLSPDEATELQEILEEYTKELRGYFKSFDNREFKV